jgi:hypothetical protein
LTSWIIYLQRSKLDKFSVDSNDILLTLTLNNDLIEGEGSLNTLIAKIIIIGETRDIELSDISETLAFMNIDKLNIVSINGFVGDIKDKINYSEVDKYSIIKYIEVGVEDFTIFLNNPDFNFLEYNKDSLYIIRNGSYMDIKNIFKKINGCNVELGRGSSQKSHMVSPLDFRLSTYLMAMFNLNYKHISYLNTFNYISKPRYLPYTSISNKLKTPRIKIKYIRL